MFRSQSSYCTSHRDRALIAVFMSAIAVVSFGCPAFVSEVDCDVNSSSDILESVIQFHPTDGQDGALYGVSVSTSGELMVIGARGDDVDGKTDQGSAYVYERNASTGDWGLVQKLTAPDGVAQQRA